MKDSTSLQTNNSPPPPGVLFIEMTNFCNMHCTFCPSDLLTKKRQHIAEGHLNKFMDQIHKLDLSPPILCNVLGEPLLNKKIFAYLDTFRQSGHPVTLITNMTLLIDKSIRQKILSHDNLTLALSLQTPNRKSYRMRKYPKLSSNKLFKILYQTIEEKFAGGSRTRLELHIASNYILKHDPHLKRDSDFPLWEVFPSYKREKQWIENFMDRLARFASRIESKYPLQYGEEKERTLQIYRDHIGPRISLSRESLPEDFQHLKGEDFWGYMFLPNVFLQFKSLELWTNENMFLESVIPQDRFIYVEERTAPFQCPMAHNLGLLSNGDFVLCCLDYGGEMKLGNIKDLSVPDVLNSEKRRRILKDAMSEPLCRRCKGNVFVFDTSPLDSSTQRVNHFGCGWEPFEEDLYGTGGRWTQGQASAYVFCRIPAEGLFIRIFSELFENRNCRVKLFSYTEDTQTFQEEMDKPFSPTKGDFTDVEIRFDFSPSTLYKIELQSPTFVPDELFHNGDTRQLGLAVLDIQLKKQLMD